MRELSAMKITISEMNSPLARFFELVCCIYFLYIYLEICIYLYLQNLFVFVAKLKLGIENLRGALAAGSCSLALAVTVCVARLSERLLLAGGASRHLHATLDFSAPRSPRVLFQTLRVCRQSASTNGPFNIRIQATQEGEHFNKQNQATNYTLGNSVGTS